MPQSLSLVVIHVIFSTKERCALLDAETRPKLHAYLSTVARNAGALWFLPTENQWYKAAYYDPTKNGTGGYWQYPPKTDDPAKMVAELPPGGSCTSIQYTCSRCTCSTKRLKSTGLRT